MEEKLCMTCGTVGKPKVMTKGSFGFEVALWLCFLIPGILYSAWRLTSKYKACKKCVSVHDASFSNKRL